MRPTGRILPRNYGIVLTPPGGKVMVSPTKYATAQLMMWTPGEIRHWVKDWARRHEEPIQATLDEFIANAPRALLNTTRRGTRHDSFLVKLRPDGTQMFAQVRATQGKPHDVYLPRVYPQRAFPTTLADHLDISYPQSSCYCPDFKHNEGKKRDFSVVCKHIAFVESSIALDSQEYQPVDQNHTGLLPRELKKWLVPNLPFPFPAKGEEQLAMDVLALLYIQRRPEYAANIEALGWKDVCTSGLWNAVSRHGGKFEVLRQREERKDQDLLTQHQDNLYGATTSLLARMEEGLVSQRFWFKGYTREFVGTKWEVVAKRFEAKRPGQPIWHLCTKSGMPPIAVRRSLGGTQQNMLENADPRTDSPFVRIGQHYDSVDDATRRVSDTLVILPTKDVPQILQDRYARLTKASTGI